MLGNGEVARDTGNLDEVFALLGRSKFSPLMARFLEIVSVSGTPFEASICCRPWLGVTKPCEPRDALEERGMGPVEAVG